MKPSRSQQGFTMLELLVAGTLGLFVTGGLISLFVSTNAVYRAENGLSRLQENARFAFSMMSRDLRMINGQYCSGKSGRTGDPRPKRRPYQSVLSGAQAASVNLPGPPNNRRYFIMPSILTNGFDCVAGASCDPLPAADIPAAGVALGNQLNGTDILAFRYLQGTGTLISFPNPASGVPITMATDPTSPPLSLGDGDIALISSCSGSTLFTARIVGNQLFHDTASGDNVDGDFGVNYKRENEARVFNYATAFRSVTYYVEVVQNEAGDEVGALFRILDGGLKQEIIRGVDRLDFRYGVILRNGAVAYLTAAEVDTETTNCPTYPELSGLDATPAPGSSGCMWSEITSVEVSVLLNTIDNVVPNNDQTFTYEPEGSTAIDPSAGMTTGLDGGQMLRREFRSVIGIRSATL